MKLNDKRLWANELILQIYLDDNGEGKEEQLAQLNILKSYTEACIEELNK